jgi:hypothetical protein
MMHVRNFDELKQALMTEESTGNAPVSIDIVAMKDRLKNTREQFNKSRLKRSFTVDNLMRSYNL